MASSGGGVLSQPIYEEQSGLRLICREDASTAFAEQLAITTFGSSGLRYRRLDTDQLLARYADARYFELYRNETLIGTYLLCPQSLSLDAEPVAGTYRGLLTIAPEHQSSGAGRVLVREALAWLRARAADAPHVTYGCIDAGNERSMGLLRSLGATDFGELRSMLVYRQWTRASPTVETLDDAESVASALEHSQADCALRPAAPRPGAYFAVRDGDTIQAGARAELVRLDLAVSGSTWPKIYGAMIDRFPPAKRRFDPRDFRYVRLHDVIALPGSGKAWRTLLRDVLHRHEAHMAMFVLDPRRETFEALADAGLFGRFSRSTEQRIQVVGNTFNIPHASAQAIRERPLAIGPSDI